jgi:hypothetical protein
MIAAIPNTHQCFFSFSSSQRHVQGAMEEIKRKGEKQQESG